MVNIQKVIDNPDVVNTKDYDINIQRIYFLDEVHRSYNPKGSLLANLSPSDTNANGFQNQSSLGQHERRNTAHEFNYGVLHG